MPELLPPSLKIMDSSNLDEPIIHFVDQLLYHAQQEAASDIHLEPYEGLCRIRYRQDGLLYEMTELPEHLASRVITRLKVMANLDISERRLPQDGRLQLNHSSRFVLDARISVCPMLHGEKIVLRLLTKSIAALKIAALGFNQDQQEIFLQKIAQPQGLILITGPTGSGKTITLYSALQYLNTKEKNILTIEDPIEMALEGINQAQLNPRLGLSFSTALRAFLRQDPDILMVGEIRDQETAEMAMQAAQTGHLVLSTLHTNNALETIRRLLAMGNKATQLLPAISLIVAQRLVRKLCLYCKQRDSQHNRYRAHGCSKCHQGYQGRTGLFECLPLSEKLLALTLKTTALSTLEKTAREEGFISLREAAEEKLRQGETSFEEIQRVL